jgi:hypothetical protein
VAVTARLPWLLLAAAASYVVVFAVRFGDIVATAMRNADTASGPVIAHLIGEAPAGREVVLGNFPWYTSLWAQQATAWLPAHRTLWEVGPFAVALLTFAVVTVATARVVGRRAALITAAVLVCAAPWTVADLGSWTLHGPSWLAVALAGWVAVWLTGEEAAGAGAAAWPARRVALAAGAGAVIGAGAASDKLVWVAGVAPLVVGVALVAVAGGRGRRGPLTGLLVTLAGVAVAAVATTAIMAAADVRAKSFPVDLASPHRVRHNLDVLFHAVAGLGNGDVFGLPFGAAKVLHLGGIVLTALALSAVAWTAGRLLVAAVRRRGADGDPAAPARVAHVAFWASSSVLLVGSFVATTAPEATYSNRYLVGLLLGVAALLPLVAERTAPARAAVLAGATAFALIGTLSLLRGELTANPSRFPTPALAHRLAAFAQDRGLAIGYASYWDATALTWAADSPTLRVFPVQQCDADHLLCPLTFHRISTWYRPRPHTRTFLLINREQRMSLVTGADPRLGPPVAVDQVGPLTIYTYPYDIAARMAGVTPGAGALQP